MPFIFDELTASPGIDPHAGCCGCFTGKVMENRYFSNVDQQLLEQVMLHKRDLRDNAVNYEP